MNSILIYYMETWRQILVFKGFPTHTSIYHSTIEDLSTLMTALKVLPGSKVIKFH